MITSRGVQLLKTFNSIRKPSQLQQIVRNSHHWNYRVGAGTAPINITRAAEFVGAFAWWWILWHLWTEPGHITGEFEYPDPTKWTNEELGIPEDD